MTNQIKKTNENIIKALTYLAKNDEDKLLSEIKKRLKEKGEN